MNNGRMNGRNRRQAASDSGSFAAPGQRGSGGKKQGGNWFARHKVFSIVSASLLIVVLVVVGYFANAMANPASVLINRTDAPSATTDSTDSSTTGNSTVEPSDSSTVPGDTATLTPTATDEQPPDLSVFPKDVVNILLLGTDAGLGRVGMGERTDSIMLVSINTTSKKVSIISVPRDTYVKIYNEKNRVSGHNRVNAAFAYGGGRDKKGLQYSINTISHFLGNVPVDHYVLFNMDLVIRLINTLGGVTVDVQLKEPVTIGSVRLEPGVHKLNSYEALAYARDRHNTVGGDFGRTGHQQQVVIAVLKELKSQGKLSMIPEIYQALSKYVKTDLNAAQMAALAWIAKDVDIDGTMKNAYTVTGSSLQINGASIVIADQSKKIDILKAVFGTKAGLNLRVNSDETYSYLYGLIKKQFMAGQTIINNANSLLANNKEYYSDAEATALKAAISAWTAASKKNDAEGMADAQQDVQTQYDILKDLIDSRQPVATPSPTTEPTADTTTTAPTEEPSTATTTSSGSGS